ncbi:MAG: SCO family protein [Phyllobacteriaceae bacterium]|nr:SCO family protein [Phyllobacteriaceae bacterium]
MTLRALRWVLWVLIAFLVIGLGVFAALREPATTPKQADASALAPVAGIGGDFALVDQSGKPFTQADLKGHPSLVFFGYTFCPDVCPTTLLEAEGWMKELGPDADRLKVVFVTVDPERDTSEKLKDYLGSFDPRFVGLTGPRPAIDRILKDYRVFARKVEGKGGDYTMDHTAAVYMLDPQGRFVGLINFQEETAKAMTKIRRLMTMS